MEYSQPTATVVADSISDHGIRLTTLQVRMHKFVLQEFNTHRMLSRNAASTRARPVSWVMDQVRSDPAMPVYWGANQKGMQASEELQGDQLCFSQNEWFDARQDALNHVHFLKRAGLHKQTANRLLEPWMWADVVVTATDWENFFNLRCHPAAQPEMRAAAEAMETALIESGPVHLSPGEWHLPYISEWEQEHCAVSDLIAYSTARCARVSVKPFDEDEANPVKDIVLHGSLVEQGHMSPTEHPAMAMETDQYCGNFRGWKQYRKTLPGEAVFQPERTAA